MDFLLGSLKDLHFAHLKHVFFTKIKGNHRLQGNVQVYNVRIPALVSLSQKWGPVPPKNDEPTSMDFRNSEEVLDMSFVNIPKCVFFWSWLSFWRFRKEMENQPEGHTHLLRFQVLLGTCVATRGLHLGLHVGEIFQESMVHLGFGAWGNSLNTSSSKSKRQICILSMSRGELGTFCVRSSRPVGEGHYVEDMVFPTPGAWVRRYLSHRLSPA